MEAILKIKEQTFLRCFENCIWFYQSSGALHTVHIYLKSNLKMHKYIINKWEPYKCTHKNVSTIFVWGKNTSEKQRKIQKWWTINNEMPACH